MENAIRPMRLKRVIPSFAVTTTSINLKTLHSLLGMSIDIEVLTGTIWVNPSVTATEANGCKLNSATLSLTVIDDLNIISDATGATVQIWIYE